MKVGLIPAGTDQVMVGDMERSRLKDVKVLFFAGVNEGSVPREKSRGGLLSEMDHERLAEQEVELAPTSRQETCIQKFYMYLNLTKPSQRLILSWSLADAGWKITPAFLADCFHKRTVPESRYPDRSGQNAYRTLGAAGRKPYGADRGGAGGAGTERNQASAGTDPLVCRTQRVGSRSWTVCWMRFFM